MRGRDVSRTHHGFAFPKRPVYDRDAAERHWERLLALIAAISRQKPSGADDGYQDRITKLGCEDLNRIAVSPLASFATSTRTAGNALGFRKPRRSVASGEILIVEFQKQFAEPCVFRPNSPEAPFFDQRWPVTACWSSIRLSRKGLGRALSTECIARANATDRPSSRSHQSIMTVALRLSQDGLRQSHDAPPIFGVAYASTRSAVSQMPFSPSRFRCRSDRHCDRTDRDPLVCAAIWRIVLGWLYADR